MISPISLSYIGFALLTWYFSNGIKKVLLGEHTETEFVKKGPTRSGLQTVLEVLQIQKNFWPTLKPSYEELESQWRIFSVQKKSKESSP